METLGRLFGSNAIVKILRLFLFNPEKAFETTDIINRTRVAADVVRLEVGMLNKVGLIKKKSFYKEVERKKGRAKTAIKKRVSGWMIDENFQFLAPLQQFFLDTATIQTDELVKKLRGAGRLQLVILAGVFLQQWDGRVDLLVVGDKLSQGKIATAVQDIESELGLELRYAAFSTGDFRYRLSMRDKLIRDILDYPHTKIINKLNLL